MITELLQQPGTFEVSLRDGTPLDIRTQVPYEVSGIPFGHLFVTPQRIPLQTLTAAAIKAAAVYAGRIGARSNQMHSYAGNGLAVWLGDADDKGNTVSAYGGGVAHTFTAAATQVLTTSALGNGITLGSTAADTGTTNTTSYALVSPIALLNEFADNTGNAWRINPNGTFDLGAPATLFAGTPTVMVMRGVGGRDIRITGLVGTTLEVDEDFDDYATFAVVTGNGASGLASVGTPPKGFSGGANAALGVDVSTSNTTTGTCNTAGTNYLNLHVSTRRHIQVSVDCPDIHSFCEPGDNIYIYDTETDLVDTGTQITYRGIKTFPVTAQLLGYTWPVVEGMGVYTIQSQDGSNTVVDLTDWVQWESGPVKFEVGAARRVSARPTVSNWGKQ